MHIIHRHFSGDVKCGIKTHVEKLNAKLEWDDGPKRVVHHYPFRNGSKLGQVLAYIRFVLSIVLTENAWICVHEYVRLNAWKQALIRVIAKKCERVFVLNSRTYWAMANSLANIEIAPAFSPEFELFDSDSENDRDPEAASISALHLLGIQDARNLDMLTSLVGLIRKRGISFGGELRIADPEFFRQAVFGDDIQTVSTNFPAPTILIDGSQIFITITRPGIDENRSMANALLAWAKRGVIIIDEIFPNLVTVMANIGPGDSDFGACVAPEPVVSLLVLGRNSVGLDGVMCYTTRPLRSAFRALFGFDAAVAFWRNM